MAPRANWKGYLRLSLVSCPIALYPASSLERKGELQPDQPEDRKPLEAAERRFRNRRRRLPRGHGARVSKSRRVSTSLWKIKKSMPCRSKAPGRSKSINSFRAVRSMTAISDSPYYIAPDGKVGQDAFAVIRDTIAKMNMVAVGRVVLTRREHIIALEARGRGLLGLTLRYPYEVRDEQPYFEDIPEFKTPKEMLDLATHIVQTKSGHFDPAKFEDRYENALIDLLKKKEAGEKIEPAKEGPTPQVVNLMDALRASIDAEKKKAPAPSTQARRPAKKRATQK